MRTTLKERTRKKLLRFGRKNRICRYLVLPALVVCMLFFHWIDFLKGNTKRLAMLAGVFCLFVVYSSFSFPLFVSGSGSLNTNFLETGSDVELAPETDIDLAGMALLGEEELTGENVLVDGGEIYDGMDSFGTTEVLAALEGYGRQEEESEAAENGEDPHEKTFSKDDWRLVLINKQHSIPDDYSFTISTFMNFKCDERILDDLADMFQAAKDDGINLVIRSPYRTHEHQVQNFNNKIAFYMNRGMSYMEAYQTGSQAVTVPGNSEHEIGLSLDITSEGFPSLLQSFGETDAGKWLAENGCKYGFIVRYPKGKEYITGIMYEPWHMRYVGAEAATEITERGITLEEFWEEL